MSFFIGDINSDVLGMRTHMAVILPEKRRAPDATLLLLHGRKCNSDDWFRKTSVERYAQSHNIAVFMPEVQRSYYTDMAYGLDYFTFVSEELPQLIAQDFNVPMDAAHLYVGGFSMGGYGAMKCVYTAPQRYAGCIALSSKCFLTPGKLSNVKDPPKKNEWQGILGLEEQISPENDLICLLDRAAGQPMPPIYLACGTEDFLYQENLQMRDALRSRGIACTYEEWAGKHDWVFWDEGIRRGIDAVIAKKD